MEITIFQNWKPGDKRQATDRQLKRYQVEGQFDSYDNAYLIDGFRWKIESWMAEKEGTVYTLVCEESISFQ